MMKVKIQNSKLKSLPHVGMVKIKKATKQRYKRYN